MKELKIYYDIARTKEVFEKIDFGIIKAGEKTRKSLFFYNTTRYMINVEINLVGESTTIVQDVKLVKGGETKELILEFNPKITMMKPLQAEFKIKINYVIT